MLLHVHDFSLLVSVTTSEAVFLKGGAPKLLILEALQSLWDRTHPWIISRSGGGQWGGGVAPEAWLGAEHFLIEREQSSSGCELWWALQLSWK